MMMTTTTPALPKLPATRGAHCAPEGPGLIAGLRGAFGRLESAPQTVQEASETVQERSKTSKVA